LQQRWSTHQDNRPTIARRNRGKGTLVRSVVKSYYIAHKRHHQPQQSQRIGKLNKARTRLGVILHDCNAFLLRLQKSKGKWLVQKGCFVVGCWQSRQARLVNVIRSCPNCCRRDTRSRLRPTVCLRQLRPSTNCTRIHVPRDAVLHARARYWSLQHQSTTLSIQTTLFPVLSPDELLRL
jgi:hypothetical protein